MRLLQITYFSRRIISTCTRVCAHIFFKNYITSAQRYVIINDYHGIIERIECFCNAKLLQVHWFIIATSDSGVLRFNPVGGFVVYFVALHILSSLYTHIHTQIRYNLSPPHSQSAFLEVVIPPDIISEETSNDMMVPEGGAAKLVCKARGYPKPDIVWKREDGAEIISRSGPGKTKSKVSKFYFAPVNRLLLLWE